MTGQRVAMIGAGASGFQIAPAIAADVGDLTVFQRTAQWMFPNPNYHATSGPGIRWALRHLPFYGRWYRFLFFWPGCDTGLDAARVDPDYTDQQQAVSETNDLARMMFTDWIMSQIGDDPDLIAKVVPDYPATGKRTLQDNGSWLKTLTRDDVDLIRTGIDRIEPGAIVTEDGERYEADVIVYATGFGVAHMLAPMEIIGRDGRDLRAPGASGPGVPGHHRPGVPQLLLHVRTRHQPGARWQPDLPLGMSDALHLAVPRHPHRRRPPHHGAARAEVRGLARQVPSRAGAARVVATIGQELVLQELVRGDPRPLAVETGRLLGLDPRTRPR